MSITGVVVCYKTPELINDSVLSIRRFYDFPIIIVDHSPHGGECHRKVDYLKQTVKNIVPVHTNQNLGHGPGMNIGIEKSKTEFILLFDSDIVLKKPCIELMMMNIEEKDYGIGQVIKCDQNGFNSKTGIEYLHPHFALIKRSKYNIFAPFRNHGAPMLDTMKGLATSSVNVRHFPVYDFVLHKERGTVNIMKSKPEARHLALNGLTRHR